jgi:patatin-like phospholipase/acyl hydrolase
MFFYIVTKVMVKRRKPCHPKLRVLSISGGAVRGLLPSTILYCIEELTGRRICDLFDLIVGTSTGSIIATILTLPSSTDPSKPKYTTEDLLKIYTHECPKVFSESTWKNITSGYGVYASRFSTKTRDQLFDEWIGQSMLSNTVVDVVIPTYELCTKENVFFKTRKAKLNKEDDCEIKEVVKGALAAPTVFPPHRMDERLYMDALYGKSPAMFSVIEAIKHYGVTLEEIELLSLGTGYSEDGSAEDISKTTHSGLGFLLEAFNCTINGNTKSTGYMVNELLSYRADQCLHIDFFIEPEYMNFIDVSPKTLTYLHQKAVTYVDDNLDRLVSFLSRLLPSPEVDLPRLELAVEVRRAAAVPLPADDISLTP